MTTSDTTVMNLAPNWRPVLLAGDDRAEASAVLNQVLERAAALADDLRAIANRHVDQAPASSAHVSDLAAAISRSVLDWIEAWPS